MSKTHCDLYIHSKIMPSRRENGFDTNSVGRKIQLTLYITDVKEHLETLDKVQQGSKHDVKFSLILSRRMTDVGTWTMTLVLYQ